MLASVSRLVGEIVTPEVRDAPATSVRKLMAAYSEKEDLIAIGAYQPGADPVIDAAIAARGAIDGFLRQRVDEPSTIADADAGLMGLAAAPLPADEAAALLDEISGDISPTPAAPGPRRAAAARPLAVGRRSRAGAPCVARRPARRAASAFGRRRPVSARRAVAPGR